MFFNYIYSVWCLDGFKWSECVVFGRILGFWVCGVWTWKTLPNHTSLWE